MQKYDTPYTTDWFAITLRWIALMGLAVSLGIGQRLGLLYSWPLVLIMIWNMVMTIQAILYIRITQHRVISFMLDLLFSALLYWTQGGLFGPAAWVGLLPILTSSIFFEYTGSLVSALFLSILMILTGVLDGNLALNYSIAFSALLFVLSLVFGYLARGMVRLIRSSRTGSPEPKTQPLDKKQSGDLQGGRMRALYDLTAAISSTLSYRRVLETAIDMGASALNPDPDAALTDPLVGMVMLFNNGKLRVGFGRRLTNPDLRAALEAEDGYLKQAVDEGEAVRMKNVGGDKELSRIVALRNCTSGYCFPLRSGLNVYGVLLFAHPEPGYFTHERCDILDIIGRQSVIAIQNARLYQDLVEEKERMVEVHEEARKKLARDLHDGPTQSVSAIAMRLNIARRMLTRDVKQANEELVKLEDLAHRTTKEIRHMLFTLRPLILESQGLTAAVQSMSDKMRETYNQNVAVAIDEPTAAQLEMGKQGVIFYIIEEAVNNARKHAQAPVINVSLRDVEGDIALLEIADNGVGFDVKAMTEAYEKRSSSSLGMVNLRERSELVNGLLQIDSAPGKGTRVRVYIPLNEDAADRLHHGRPR